jgi:hypothetical protein
MIYVEYANHPAKFFQKLFQVPIVRAETGLYQRIPSAYNFFIDLNKTYCYGC